MSQQFYWVYIQEKRKHMSTQRLIRYMNVYSGIIQYTKRQKQSKHPSIGQVKQTMAYRALTMTKSILMWNGVHSTLSSQQSKNKTRTKRNKKSNTISQCAHICREKSRIYSKYYQQSSLDGGSMTALFLDVIFLSFFK